MLKFKRPDGAIVTLVEPTDAKLHAKLQKGKQVHFLTSPGLPTSLAKMTRQYPNNRKATKGRVRKMIELKDKTVKNVFPDGKATYNLTSFSPKRYRHIIQSGALQRMAAL